MLLKKKRIENDREAGQLIASPDEHASAERADPHSPAPSPCSTEATIPQVEIEDPVLPSQQLSSSSLMCNCPECNNQFSCMKVLNRHRKTCGRTLKFSCSQCDKIFAQKNSLNRHENTHSSEKMWACEHHNCGKFFALKEYLDAHMKTHLSLECSNKKDLVEPVTPSDILAQLEQRVIRLEISYHKQLEHFAINKILLTNELRECASKLHWILQILREAGESIPEELESIAIRYSGFVTSNF